MTQSNDLPSRLNRAEDGIIDLRLAASALLQATDKNSANIAALIEISRRNSEGLSALLEVSSHNSEQITTLQNATSGLQTATSGLQTATSALQASQARTEETIRSIQAAIERMDRLFDYLIRRDQERLE